MDKADAAQLLAILREQDAATLAAAIVSAAGRPFSIQEVLDIKTDVFWALYPSGNMGSYQEWAKTRNERLSKVHK